MIHTLSLLIGVDYLLVWITDDGQFIHHQTNDSSIIDTNWRGLFVLMMDDANIIKIMIHPSSTIIMEMHVAVRSSIHP
jgi:hypothetical protein